MLAWNNAQEQLEILQKEWVQLHPLVALEKAQALQQHIQTLTEENDRPLFSPAERQILAHKAGLIQQALLMGEALTADAPPELKALLQPFQDRIIGPTLTTDLEASLDLYVQEAQEALSAVERLRQAIAHQVRKQEFLSVFLELMDELQK